MVSALRYEVSKAIIFSLLYRDVHDEPVPISRIVSLSGKHHVPLPSGDYSIFEYFENPAIYGDGYRELLWHWFVRNAPPHAKWDAVPTATEKPAAA